MPSPLPPVEPGELIQASKQNDLIAQVNATAHLAAGGPLVAAHGAGGFRAALRDLRRIAIWELTGSLERAKTDNLTDDVPSATANPVWYFPVDGYPPDDKYQDAGQYSRAMRVYHVGGFPGDQRQKLVAVSEGKPGSVAIPRFGAGDWVYAEFNNQSGRWEIMSGPEDVWRFELKTALVPSGDRDVPSTAEAYLVIYDPEQGKYVRTDVQYSVADFLDIWEGKPGDRGYAKRLADSHLPAGWEVVIMRCDSSSGSGSSSGESSSSSGESSSGLTTSIDVVVCDPYRVGDSIYFPQKRLRFVDGLLVEVSVLGDTEVYLCCSGSSSGDSSSGDSSSGDSSSGEASSGQTSSTPCGFCTWRWNPGTWSKNSDLCDPGCPCDPPDFAGSYEGQVETTWCYPGSSSGETSSGETSSGACGFCTWGWNPGTWSKNSDLCDPGCRCDPPDFPGSYEGQVETTWCYLDSSSGQ